MTSNTPPESVPITWTWEELAIIEHALEELLHIGTRYECFDKEYRSRISKLLEQLKKSQ